MKIQTTFDQTGTIMQPVTEASRADALARLASDYVKFTTRFDQRVVDSIMKEMAALRDMDPFNTPPNGRKHGE